MILHLVEQVIESDDFSETIPMGRHGSNTSNFSFMLFGTQEIL